MEKFYFSQMLKMGKGSLREVQNYKIPPGVFLPSVSTRDEKVPGTA